MSLKMRYDHLVDLLSEVPHGTGAVIGVNEGETCLHLLKHLPELNRLYCVDSWEVDTKKQDYFKRQEDASQAMSIFLENVRPFQDRVIVLRQWSTEAANAIVNESLDWVFIDANHQYPYVRADILAWMPKVKPGGLVSGHDFAKSPYGIGVQKAVKEIFGDDYSRGRDVTWWHWKK